MRIYIFVPLLAAIHSSLFAATPDVMSVDEAVQKHLLLAAPKPDYPYEARVRRRAGTGLFELKFDYDSGRLREVHVVESIGDRYLDGHAIGALKLWKAKPRAIHNLRVPIMFTLAHKRSPGEL